MKRAGYILFETMASLAVLSIGMVAINEAIRQAIITRGQAQDYTVARFLMEKLTADKEIEWELQESQGKGTFPSPYERFSHEWKIDKIEVPEPPLPPNLPPEIVKQLKENLAQNRYLGRLSVTISWTRAGGKFTAEGETLLRPGQLWLPSEAAP